MKRSLEEKRRRTFALLRWASAASGLPITDISQCQNGALFCIVTAMACSPNDAQLQQVNYEARSESQCWENYKILQKLAAAAQIEGLNLHAGFHSWVRLMRSRTDAEHYLSLLRKSLEGMELCTLDEIDEEATPPPSPCLRQGGGSRGSSRSSKSSRRAPKDSSEVMASADTVQKALPSPFAPLDFGYRMPSGSLKLELESHASGAMSLDSTQSLTRDPFTGHIFSRTESDESMSFGLSDASSMASSLEGFLFPQDLEDFNDIVRQSLDTSKLPREPRVSAHTSLFGVPALKDIDILSEKSSGSMEIDSLLPSTPMRHARAYSGPYAAEATMQVLDMIRDLDEMIASLSYEQRGLNQASFAA